MIGRLPKVHARDFRTAILTIEGWVRDGYDAVSIYPAPGIGWRRVKLHGPNVPQEPIREFKFYCRLSNAEIQCAFDKLREHHDHTQKVQR